MSDIMIVEADVVQQENVSIMLQKVERWVLFSTILGSSMAFIDTSALNVALPALYRPA